MARLITTGAEINHLAAEGAAPTSGSPTITTTNPRTGTYAFRSSAAGDALGATFSGVLGRRYFARVAQRYDALPGAGVVNAPISFTTLAGAIVVDEFGAVTLRPTGGSATVIATSATTVVAGGYYVFELAVLVNVGAVDTIEGRVDGIAFGATTGLSLSDSAMTRVNFCAYSGVAVTVDDVALNDDQGASQNSWPGLGKIVLLKPISLNANGGSWTDSAGATTSAGLTDSIDNTPPTGIADTTASADHQDRNAAANTSLDMNLTTYATAGVAAADTINVVQPICSTGAPVVTAAKTGSLGITTNPTIANAAFVNGGTAAANFWSGVTAGTYPTGWKWERGTTTYAPTVTVSSSPVARVTITGGTTTRIAMVCFLGMYVDYTPAAVTLSPIAGLFDRRNPHRRSMQRT